MKAAALLAGACLLASCAATPPDRY